MKKVKFTKRKKAFGALAAPLGGFANEHPFLTTFLVASAIASVVQIVQIVKERK